MLKDYKNSDEILKNSGPIEGEWITSEDKQLLNLQFEEKNVKFGESKTDAVELHVYDLNGNLLASNHVVDKWKATKPEEQQATGVPRLFLDPHSNLRDLGFKRGEYKFVYNFVRPLLGEYNSNRQLFIKEIKSNKTELVLSTNIVRSDSEPLNQEFEKVKAQIDKFFNIQNRVADLTANLDSTQLPTITKENNKIVYNKFVDIKQIIDDNVLRYNLDRNAYIEYLVNDTIEKRSNSFEYGINEDLRNIVSKADLLNYYVHTIPNAKWLELRDEIYFLPNASDGSSQLPTGVNNTLQKDHPDYQSIVIANATLKSFINNILIDPDFSLLTDRDISEIESVITTPNTTIATATGNAHLSMQTFLNNPEFVPRGSNLLQNNQIFSTVLDNVTIKYNTDIQRLEKDLIAYGNEDFNTDGITPHINVNATEISLIKKQLENSKLILQEIETLRTLFVTRKTSVTQDEIAKALKDAKEHLDNKILLNTIKLTNEDFNYVVQPADDYFELFELNFGNNNILKITNIIRLSDTDIGVKLYEPIPKTISTKQSCWINKDIRRAYTDNIILLPAIDGNVANTLSGPNFHIETHDLDSKDTDFQTWTELLGTNANTSQQIIDNYFSGSIGDVKLNVNYCELENFVHFSSATERVKNFHYKLELLEFYDARMDVLLLAAQSGSVSTNITDTITKQREVVSGFDDFEKWMYFESGSQELYTFDSCSITPWPKNVTQTITTPLTWLEAYNAWVSASYTWVSGATTDIQTAFRPYTLVATSGSLDYYQNLLEKAEEYDKTNPHALYRSIPDHVRADKFNEDYELFVNMVGQHFDIMWSYINHLTRINTREEHPKDGIPDDLIFDVAKSMGWHLANGNYDAKLWDYALGTNENGVVQSSGSFMPSKSKDKITKEIWRRQLNNLPYLLKTKGTERSVRALVACYGVPQSILTVREYGGPSRSNKKPTYNKNQFDYALNLADSRHVQTEWAPILSSTGSTYSYPDTITLRFKTHNNTEFNYGGYGKHTLLQVDSGSDTRMFVELEPTSSAGQGNLHFYMSGSGGYLTASILDECIFDDEFTSIMIQRATSSDATLIDNTYNFYVKKHKWNKLTINASASINISSPGDSSYNDTWTTSGSMYLGLANNPSNTTYFTGSVQELRYWNVPLDESIFNNHVTSVGSYNSNNPTGSFYELQTRFNLIDNIDIDATPYISSSHPDQTQNTFENGNTIIANFEGTWPSSSVSWLPWEEKQYIEGASLGGNNLYADKIRIEGTSLRGTLNPKSRQEVSAFDSAPLDGKRLGVYFSPQSIINDDIFRHLGFFELDDYIGSPGDLYKDSYPELKDIAQEYWKKYSNKNDIAEYIRLFSVFDFTMFKQIKQLLPGRANAVTGLVIEPNVLERNKVLTRRPNKTELDYKAEFEYVYPDPDVVETTHVGEVIIEEEELSAEETTYKGQVDSTEVIDLSVQEDSIADTENSDYELHNHEGEVAINKIDIIDIDYVQSQSALIITKDYSKPSIYSHDYLLVDKNGTPSIFSTGSSAPWLSSPTQSIILGVHTPTSNQSSNYWVHEETGWLSPTSASTFSSSLIDWAIPSGTLYPATSSGTDADTYTIVYSGFGAQIGAKPIGFNDPYNFVFRGVATTLGRYSDDNDANYVIDKTVTIGTDLITHTGTNLAQDVVSETLDKRSLHEPTTTGTSGSIAGIYGAFDWKDTQNVTASSTEFAYVTGSTIAGFPGYSEYLVTGNYGFNIPSSSLISGIEMKVSRKGLYSSGDAYITSASIYLSKNSGSVHPPFDGTIETINTPWSLDVYPGTTSSYTTDTYGGSTSLWGTTWTPAEINSTDFGAYYQVRLETIPSEYVWAYVNDITVEVFYVDSGSGGWRTSSQKVIYGDNHNDWGQTFTREDLVSDDFNFKLQAAITGSTTANVDDVKVKLFYSYFVTGSDKSFQEYVPLGISNHRYNGCKVTSPDINEPSQDTFDKGPVVESTAANPNGLILKRKNAARGVFDIGESPIKIQNRS